MGMTTNGENGNMALDDMEPEGNDDTTERRRHHRRRGRGKPSEKKGPRDINVSWATGKFFFLFSSFFFFSLTIIFGTNVNYGKERRAMTRKATQHLAPAPTAASHCSQGGQRVL